MSFIKGIYKISNIYLNNTQQNIIREISRRSREIRKSFPHKNLRTELRVKILKPEENKDDIIKIKKSINAKSYGDFLTERTLSRKKLKKSDILQERTLSRKDRQNAVKKFLDNVSK